MNLIKKIALFIFLVAFISPLFSQSIQVAGKTIGADIIENINSVPACDAEIFIPVSGFLPSGVSSDGDRIWVTGSFSNETTIYDETGTMLETLSTPYGVVGDMHILEDTLWMIAEQAGQLIKINKNTGELYDMYSPPIVVSSAGDPNHWGVTSDGENLWVSEYGGSTTDSSCLFRISPIDGAPLDTVYISQSLILSIFFANGELYGITYSSEQLYHINTITGEYTLVDGWCTSSPYGTHFDPCKGLLGTGNAPNAVYKITELDLTTYGCSSIDIYLCEGGVYNGVTYFESATHYDTISLINYDSILVTNINVFPAAESSISFTQCEDPSFEPGIYETVDILQSINGCDSIATTTLTVYAIEETNIDIPLFLGEEYMGVPYFSDTILIDIYASQYGCDSIVTTNIMVEISSAEEGDLIIQNIFPNPVNSKLTISGITAIPAELIVYDNMGRMVYKNWHSNGGVEIDVRAWGKGIYYLILRDERGSVKSGKVVVQ